MWSIKMTSYLAKSPVSILLLILILATTAEADWARIYIYQKEET